MANPKAASDDPIINPKALGVIVAFLAIGAVVAFAVLSWIAIVDVINGGVTPPNEAFTYVATALSGLVGGIVAAAFGISPSADKLSGLSGVTTAGAINRQWVGLLYVIVYVVVGVAAAIVWVAHQDTTSGLVKNLATIFIGMIIPIVAGYFASKK